MSDDEHNRIVRRYYDEVFAQRNLAALDELFAPNFVGHSAAYRGANPPSRSEEGGTYTLAEMHRDIAREHEAMPEDQTIVEEQIAERDRVVTRWRYRWKHDHRSSARRRPGSGLPWQACKSIGWRPARSWSAGRSRISGAS
jgi:hypothetical protein